MGKDILLAGLVIQIVTFAFFTVCAIHFDITVAKSGRHGGKWRWLMKALYAACALILVSSYTFASHCSEISLVEYRI
jgi:hypothetical protein